MDCYWVWWPAPEVTNGVGPVVPACTVVAVLEVVADGGLNKSGFLTFPLPDIEVVFFEPPAFWMKPCLLPPNFLFSKDDKVPLFSPMLLFYFYRF